MFEIIVAVLAIVAVVVIVILFKSSSREFQPKLSIQERVALEKGMEKEAVEKNQEKENPKETAVPKKVTSAPQRDPKLEIIRFKTFFDIENDHLTKTVRNGIEKCNHSDFKGAIGEFSSAIDIKPEDPIGHYCRALTKLRLRNYESSIPDFTEARQLLTEKNKELITFYVLQEHSQQLLAFSYSELTTT